MTARAASGLLPAALGLLFLAACALPGGYLSGRNGSPVGIECRLLVNRGLYLRKESQLLASIPPGRMSPASAWKLERHRRELAAMTGRLAACGEVVGRSRDQELVRGWRELALASGSPGLAAMAGKIGAGPSPPPAGGKEAAATAPKAETAAAPGAPVRAVGKKGKREKADTAALLARARALYSSGSLAGAEELWHRVLALDPGNREAANGLERAGAVRRRLESLAGKPPSR